MVQFIRKVSLVALMVAGLATGPVSAETKPTDQQSGVTDKEILVSSLSMTSGPFKFYGLLSNMGIDALINSVNDSGGVFGRKIRCLHPDDKFDKDIAIANFNKAVEQGVFGFISITGSPTSAAYIPRIENSKIPAIGGYSAPEFVNNPVKHYYFQTRPSYLEETEKMVDELWDQGVRRFGIVYQFDAYGRDFIEGGRKALAKHGSKFAVESSYQKGQEKFDDVLSQLKAANPPLEAVVMTSAYGPTIKIMKLAREAHWNPVFALPSTALVPLVNDIGTDFDGEPLSEVVPLYTHHEEPAVVNFKKAMAKYFPNEQPNVISFKGYLDALVFVEALKRTGKDLTREKFVATLDKMKNVELGLGKGNELSYSPQDHWGLHKIFWATMKKGTVVPYENWSVVKGGGKTK